MLSTCPAPSLWLGPGVGEGVKGAGWGGGQSRSSLPHPCTHALTLQHTLTSLPSCGFSLCLFPSSSISNPLSVSLTFSVSLSFSLLSPPPFIFTSSFICVSFELYSCSPFSHPFCFSLLPSHLLISTLSFMVPLSTALPCPPKPALTHTYLIFYTVFLLYLLRFNYI